MIQKRSIWRALFSALVGGMGGISLTATIFPYLIARLFNEISFETLTAIMNSTLMMALLWAIGGGIIGWLGGARTGAIVLGLCGAVTGLTLGIMVSKGDPLLIVAGVIIGLVYSVPGGLIMGRVFPKPVTET